MDYARVSAKIFSRSLSPKRGPRRRRVSQDEALESLRRLDCANRDLTLASCDPSVPPPSDAVAWRKSLEAARVDDADYDRALAVVLKTLVCSGDDHAGFFYSGARPDISFFSLGSASYILRGLTSLSPGYPSRLAATGPEAPALIDFIMSKDCLVSTALTDDDRADFMRIKQDAEKKQDAERQQSRVASGGRVSRPPPSLAYWAAGSLLTRPNAAEAERRRLLGRFWRKHGNATHQGSERRGADFLGRRRGDRAAGRFL